MTKTNPYLHAAPEPSQENERLLALKNFGVLDTPPEIAIDEIAALAAKICGTPMAIVSLVDKDRQWSKARFGIAIEETPREFAFCAHAINQSTIFVVEDTMMDTRFQENPLVTDAPKIRFYAGAPLKTSAGYNIGTLCVLDYKPRTLTEEDRIALTALAKQVIVSFEHQQLTRQLRARDNFLGNILAMLPDLVSYIDTEFRYQYVNPPYENWFKVDFTKIKGKKMVEVLGEQAFALAKPYMEKALSGQRQDFQLKMPYMIDGSVNTKYVQAHYIPDRKEDGSIAGFFAVVSDVTPIKMAEETAIKKNEELDSALEESKKNENSFRAIFENAPVGIINIDKNFNLLKVNSAYVNLLGYSEEELMKMNVLELTHPDDKVKVTKAKDAITVANPMKRLKKRYIHKSGKSVWTEVSSRAVKLTPESEEVLFSVIEDVSDLHELQQQLDVERQKSIHNAKLASLGEMSAGIAHEINNPLAIISASLAILEHVKDDPEKLKSKVDTVQRATERIAKIVRGLRKFSRTSERSIYEKESLSKLLHESMILVEAKAKRHSVQVVLSLQENLQISCSEIEIEQVFVNLLNNSIDAVKNLDERWIKVKSSEDAKNIVLHFEDSGFGIPKPAQDKIFQPFFTTKPVGEGTGLGLSISKGILDEHGASIQIISQSKHTCFELKFPRVSD